MARSTIEYIRDLVVGILIFATIVIGITYFLQSSLILYKQHGAHVHWSVVLFLVPAVAGLLLRLKRITSPLFSCLLGAVASTAILYPLYESWWASPPGITDAVIYLCIVFGIAYIATQPLTSTFMLAFRLGRYSLAPAKGSNGGGKKPRRSFTSTTTRPIYSEHGSAIALLELLIGICSLVLSIFSVFYLGKG